MDRSIESNDREIPIYHIENILSIMMTKKKTQKIDFS